MTVLYFLLSVVAISNFIIMVRLVKINRNYTLIGNAVYNILEQIQQCTDNTDQRVVYNQICIRHLLYSIRTYLISAIDKAVECEDYKEADRLKQIIQSIDKLIKNKYNKK